MSGRRWDNIIFDLDGTLVDSLPGIEASARHAVGKCLPGISLPQLRELIGPPIRTIFSRLWPERDRSEIDAIVAAFRQHYDSEGCLLSRLYPGVPETLGQLRDAGLTMFVLTNKLSLSAGIILENAGIRPFFSEVMSPDSAEPPYSVKSEGAALLQARHHLVPERTILMGDGMDDMEAAAACGFVFLAAVYGYGRANRDRAPGILFAQTFSEIARLML
jgi:phosphoglycolate phosphatase